MSITTSYSWHFCQLFTQSTPNNYTVNGMDGYLYAIDSNGELFLINSHIPLYRQSSYNNHNPKGDRKLLLNKKEINKLIGRINQEGLTIIPTKMYFIKGKVKVEIAVAKGKKLYDKRQVKKTRDWNREKARLLSKNNK